MLQGVLIGVVEACRFSGDLEGPIRTTFQKKSEIATNSQSGSLSQADGLPGAATTGSGSVILLECNRWPRL
jgi:hypothetical protein